MSKIPELTTGRLILAPAPLVCVECKAESEGTARGWRAYVAAGLPGEEAETFVSSYCPACAEREFG
jgi:hypothetical protein